MAQVGLLRYFLVFLGRQPSYGTEILLLDTVASNNSAIRPNHSQIVLKQ